MSEWLRKMREKQEATERRALGVALREFMRKIMANGEPGPPERPGDNSSRLMIYDDPMRQHATENYRQAVERAAAAGIETALTWHTLGVWTEDGRERIGYFSRALQCVEQNRDAHLRPDNAHSDWEEVHTRADCLYEIGRVHAHEGDPAVARDFLLRALPLAQEAERLRAAANVTHEDNLEGRIAERLLQLPDEAP